MSCDLITQTAVIGDQGQVLQVSVSLTIRVKMFLALSAVM